MSTFIIASLAAAVAFMVGHIVGVSWAGKWTDHYFQLWSAELMKRTQAESLIWTMQMNRRIEKRSKSDESPPDPQR